MSLFVDVALPLPLDQLFTYRLDGVSAEVGARVLVPFAGQRLVGFAVRVHDVAPAAEFEVKAVDRVMDEAPLLAAELMALGRWVAEYYCAPLGEVLRGMAPLGAEVRRQVVYRIGEAGRRVLYEGAAKGSSRRSRLSVEEQNREYAVLNYLESGEAAKISALRSAAGANKALLDAMAKKKWLVREAVAEARDARRVEMVAVLVEQGTGPGAQGTEGGEQGTGSREQGIGVWEQKEGVEGWASSSLGEEVALQPRSQNRDLGHPADPGHSEVGGGRTQIPSGNDKQGPKQAEEAALQPRSQNRDLGHPADPEVGGSGTQISFGNDKQGPKQAEEAARFSGSEGPDPGHPGSVAEGRRLPKLNENQLAVMAELAGCGGRERVRELQARLERAGVPEGTLGTLVRRGLVRMEEVQQAFHVTGLGVAGTGSGPGESRKRFAHEHLLNEAQTEALASLAAALGKGGFQPHLLYGVTGSGKTAVYVAAMQRALAAGRSALLLVPEIGLTPATAAQMVAAFGSEVALLHSQLTPDERAEQWHRVRRGEARVVVGTRSAVFAPLVDLGLILVDEEHDASYKQEETPRYHGRDVAVMRAKLLGCAVVLGSATPSLESWHNAELGRYQRLEMLTRVADRPLPVVESIDMREEFRQTGQERLFSRQLLEETRGVLDRGEQAILLLNRRGYSAVVMCRSCGDKVECENCAISLTFHKSGDERELAGPARVGATTPLRPGGAMGTPGARLECHYCGYRRGVPERCPSCQSEHLFYLGAGSQQGEERLAELFPGARLGRMDRDTVRTRGDMERLLQRLHSGEINLLVGTQMIAKGHDLHGVTLVGVVGADFALGLPDFRAAERVFQLLTQVSGRAGRGELPGRVLVQTYQPDHYVHQFARKHDFTGFAAREMYFRRGARYPPLTALANVMVQSESLTEALDWSGRLGAWLGRERPKGVRVAGPAAAPIARLKRIFRYHLVLRAERRDALRGCLRGLLGRVEKEGIPRRAVVVDVDALHLM